MRGLNAKTIPATHWSNRRLESIGSSASALVSLDLFLALVVEIIVEVRMLDEQFDIKRILQDGDVRFHERIALKRQPWRRTRYPKRLWK